MVWLLLVAVGAVPELTPVPIPKWVDAIDVPSSPTKAEGSDAWLLEDEQILADSKGVQTFHRSVWKVLSSAGIEALAHREFEWNPAWETLRLHGVWIWRDGKRQSAWSPDDARIVQRESNLDEGLYDGRKTLMLELRDLRIGDVLEVASTSSGQNPVFKDHFSLLYSQDTFEPIAHHALRVIWERPRPLNFMQHAGATAPVIRSSPGRTEYRWSTSTSKARTWESYAPSSSFQAPTLELSDWASWQEVEVWARGLFAVAPNARGQLDARIKALRALPEGARLRAAIRFVQDDVRYVGVELGEHSHLPHSPDWVLERGFGDCKDKALLLTAMLQGLGFDASPALVSTWAGERLPQMLPSPQRFNHAIVRLMLSDGPHFIDATQSGRRGDPTTWDAPPYLWSLVVGGGSSELISMPEPKTQDPTWELEQHWKVPTFTGPAELDITTTASARDAAYLRKTLNEAPLEQMRERKREQRETQLKVSLESMGLDWKDDEATDRVTVHEHYRVKDFFEHGEHEFTTVLLDDHFSQPPRGARTMPLALRHPQAFRETIIYDAPESLDRRDFELENKTITSEAFNLLLMQSVSDARLKLEWRYVTLRDRIEPTNLDAYRASLKEARGYLGYSVTEHRSTQGGRAKSGDEAGGGFFCGVVVVAMLVGWLISRQDNAPTVDAPSWRARFKMWRFRRRQRSVQGELATNPLVLPSVESAQKFFRGERCVLGHAWPKVSIKDTVRLGDERIAIVARRCASCAAEEHRYVKLPRAND